MVTDHWRRLEIWAAALWLLSSGVAATAAVLGWVTVMGVSLAALVVTDVLMHSSDEPRIPKWLGRREMGTVDRALFRESVVLVGWVLDTHPRPWAVVVGIAAVAVVHGCHVAFRAAAALDSRRQRGRLEWRNLDVPGLDPSPRRLAATLPEVPPYLIGSRVLLQADIAVLVAAWLAWALRSPLPLVCALVLLVLLALLLAHRVRRHLVHVAALPTAEEANSRLFQALTSHAPEVAVYFSGGRGTTYQLNVWLETIDRLTRPAVIVVRERHHLAELLDTDTPVVVLPRARDVEAFCVPSIRVVLYPTTVIKNNHMIRLPGLLHVFINHGDGDKAVTYSPLHRVFDEIWVAGRAACDRYLDRGEGVRAEQLRRVGRPQLAHIRRRDPARTGPSTVLYAPTWEGNFSGVDYSSVASMGERIIEELTRPELGLTVLFKAHPATGTRLPAAARARAAIEARLSDPANRHRVVGSDPDALYRAFNECDVLVADISSVVADFLASRKPYLVTNTRGLAEEQFRREFPSTGAAALVGPDVVGLGDQIRDALGEDRYRQSREALATYFLGEPHEDPVARFADEVERAIGRAPQRQVSAERLEAMVAVADPEPAQGADPAGPAADGDGR